MTLTGPDLQAWRIKAGISQSTLGKALGLYRNPSGSCPTVSKWESGTHPISASRANHLRVVARRKKWPAP